MAHDGYGYQTAARPRPTAVTVIGILFIIFGGMGIIALPINILQMTGHWPGQGQAMWQHPTLGLWFKIQTPLGAVVSILMVIAGIGLLRLYPWARKLAIGIVLYNLLTQIVSLFVVVPNIPALMAASQPAGAPPEVMGMMKGVMTVAMTVGVIIGFAIVGLVLWLLTKPDVREAFEPPRTPSAAAWRPPGS